MGAMEVGLIWGINTAASAKIASGSLMTSPDFSDNLCSDFGGGKSIYLAGALCFNSLNRFMTMVPCGFSFTES